MDPVKNFAKVTVSTGYNESAVTIVLTTGHGAKFPDPATEGAFNLVWFNGTDYADPSDDPNVEIVRCTARSTDTLTVTRGQEGIASQTHNTGGKVYKMMVSLTKAGFDSALADYAKLAGRAGGQTLSGGTAASENLALQSTTHTTKGKIRSTDKIFFDSTGGFYDFGAQVNLHSERIDVSASHKPAVYIQVTGKGDVTQINDYKIGLKVGAVDKSDVAPSTRGSLLGLHAFVIPLIARTTPNYDDAVPLSIANEGTAKATEGIYIDHNAGVSGGKDFAIGINIACNADYGLTVQGVVVCAMRIPNNIPIAARNYAGGADYAILTLDVNDQIVIGQSGIGVYMYQNLSMGGNLYIGGAKVVGARVTGWTAASGTKSKATFVTDSVTLPNLAARVGQVIDDLIAHGLIGA